MEPRSVPSVCEKMRLGYPLGNRESHVLPWCCAGEVSSVDAVRPPGEMPHVRDGRFFDDTDKVCPETKDEIR